MTKITSLIEVLPAPCLKLIKYLFDFLDLVAKEAEVNKMPLQNLAVLTLYPSHITCRFSNSPVSGTVDIWTHHDRIR